MWHIFGWYYLNDLCSLVPRLRSCGLDMSLFIKCTDIWFWTLNSMWPGDAIWRHRTWFTLSQVMAWCLMAPSHYLNQCWLIISEVLWQSPQWKMLNISILHMSLKITHWILEQHLPGANELMKYTKPDRTYISNNLFLQLTQCCTVMLYSIIEFNHYCSGNR